MPKVLIADQLSPAAVAIFKERGVEADTKTGLSKDELLKIIGDYDGLAVRSATKVTAEVLKAAKKLKVIGRAGIGVDNVDMPAATAAGIIVMNTPFGNSITTAEHAIALMMALARDIPAANASTHAGKWEKNRFMGVELYGKTLGLVGCGNIGSIVADRAKGLKMRVVAFDPYLSPERADRSRRREGRVRRAARARRFHLAAHAADQRDEEHHLGRRDRENEEGRAPDQLRARRSGRRSRGQGRARLRPARRRGVRRVRRRAREERIRCSATSAWSRRRISAPRPWKRRRTSRCRSPSRSPTIC